MSSSCSENNSKETQEENVSTNDVLKAQYRDTAAPLKSMRKDGFVPGTVYGKGFDSVNIMVPKASLQKFFTHSGKIFEVEVEGHGKHLVAIDQLQRGPMGSDYIHFSFHKVSADVKTTVTLPIHFVGKAVGSSEGGIVYPAIHEVEVKGYPKDFPEFVEVDVSDLKMDSHFALKDITPPKSLEWAHAANDSVVSCHAPRIKSVSAPVEEVVAVETVAVVTPVESTEKKAA